MEEKVKKESKFIDNVGDRMFVDASNMTSVSLPSGLESIGYGAFCRTGLTEVYIPAGVAVIGETSFYGCPNLADVTVMNPVVEIYGDTFEDCAAGLILHSWAGSLVEDYADENVSVKVVKLIESYAKIVNETVW